MLNIKVKTIHKQEDLYLVTHEDISVYNVRLGIDGKVWLLRLGLRWYVLTMV
jgi:hypothetical protein